MVGAQVALAAVLQKMKTEEKLMKPESLVKINDNY